MVFYCDLAGTPQQFFYLVQHIDLLREAVAYTRQRHPFRIHAWVVLPDHLHCILELPAP
ncbi:hypothetical protein [Deefgea sp. CFH1-16]|uniref:hypothetical protein n=1 Tax=Deefgea sp. CFH1-16 TaxID=2675457 RepID=UPI00194037CE|nr:hypothetical protein [Deefgea sp. CFH1-16]